MTSTREYLLSVSVEFECRRVAEADPTNVGVYKRRRSRYMRLDEDASPHGRAYVNVLSFFGDKHFNVLALIDVTSVFRLKRLRYVICCITSFYHCSYLVVTLLGMLLQEYSLSTQETELHC